MAKYITTIMKRIKISDEMFVFYYDKIIEGELEEEIFIDQDDNRYYETTSKESIEEENDYSYGVVAEIEEVKNSLGEDYLELFESQNKNKMAIVHQKTPGDYYKYTVDLETVDNKELVFSKDVEALKQYFEQLVNTLDQSIEYYSLEELNTLKTVLSDQHNLLNQVVEKIIAEKTPKKRKRKKPIDAKDLYNKVTKVVVAQEMPVRRIISEIERKEKYPKLKNKGILITGETGIGKKELIRQIAKELDKPILEIDATQLSLITYTGISIEEYLWDLYVNCDYDIDKAEQAIIYIEGIDKKGTPNQYNLSGQFIINELLPLIEGTTYNAIDDINSPSQTVPINTSKMIKIFDGTFKDVYDLLRENSNFGYGIDLSPKGKYRNATTQDFINNSYMTEAFIDHNLIVRMNDLVAQDFKRILLESTESPIFTHQKMFNGAGVSLKFTEEYFDAISYKSQKRKDGVRGLYRLVDDSVWMAYEEVISNPKKYKDKRNQYEVVITQDTIDDPSQFIVNEVKEMEPKTYQKGKSTKKIG